MPQHRRAHRSRLPAVARGRQRRDRRDGGRNRELWLREWRCGCGGRFGGFGGIVGGRGWFGLRIGEEGEGVLWRVEGMWEVWVEGLGDRFGNSGV